VETTFLAWNIENWGSVLLMAAAGYLLFLVIVKLMQRFGAQGLRTS
jgi:hypothetical protein